MERIVGIPQHVADTSSPSMSPTALLTQPRSSNQSPLRPGSSLIAYQPNGTTSPKTPGGTRATGKSSHMQQLKSLGLLHDLQDYISSVESLAADQKRELERIKEEKRDMEKFLARTEAQAERVGGGAMLDFSSSEVADLPPRMRALVEDNRGLRDTVKKYKSRTQSLEHTVTQQQNQVLALAEANEKLKASLAECSRTPAEVEREDTLKKQLELKTRQVENLEHSLGVLRNKVDTDSKLYRQNLTAAAREKDALKRQLVAANKTIEERDKDVRALNVELRKSKRGAPPTRAGVVAGTYRALGSAGEAAGADDGGAAAVAAVEPEERIRIMLMIVRDEVIVEVPVEVRVEVPVEVRVEVPVEVRIEVPVPVETLGTPTARGGAHSGTAPGDAAELVEKLQGLQRDQEPEQEAAEARTEAQTAEQEAQGEAEPAATEEEPAVAAAEPAAAEVEPGPEPEPEPVEASLAQEEPEAVPADADGELEAEPSAMGLQEEDMVPAGAWGTAPADDEVGAGGEKEEGDGGSAEAQADVEVPEGGAEAAADGDGGGEGSEDAGGMMSHSSPPMPVPYSRTAARALAARVGGTSSGSVKQPHPPVGATGGSPGSGSGRKPSASSSTSASSTKGAGKGSGSVIKK